MNKSILWIEDFDNTEGNVRTRRKELKTENYEDRIKEVYPEEFQHNVICRTTFTDAIKFIENYFGKFDFVVLDINLNKNFDMEFLEIEDFKKYIEIPKTDNEQINRDKLEKESGYYLYLYLLSKGFPKDRIIMRTAYKEENNVKEREDGFKKIGITAPISYSKINQEHDFKKKITESYINKNIYYEVRNIIFTACDHWISELEILKSKDSEDIDNTIIYNKKVKDKEEKKLNPEVIINTLDQIKSLLPLQLPTNINVTYFQVLRTISVDFEAYFNEKGKIEDTYYQIMKLFRNWISHKRIREPSNEKEFLFIFIIALRAYFGKEKQLLAYEKYAKKLFGSKDRFIFKKNEIDNNLYKSFSKIYYNTMLSENKLNKVLDLIGKNKECNYVYLMNLLKYNIVYYVNSNVHKESNIKIELKEIEENDGNLNELSIKRVQVLEFNFNCEKLDEKIIDNEFISMLLSSTWNIE